MNSYIASKIKLAVITLGFFFNTLTLNAYQNPFNFNNCIKWLATHLQFSKKENIDYIGFISIEKDLESAKNIIRTLLELRDDPKIKGVIVHMNCPGGSFGTSQAIFSEIKKFKKIKPIVVVVENYCCSCAYYIATACDFIFALPSSELGSIGVITTIKKCKDLKFNEDRVSGAVEYTIITTGKFKNTGPYGPLENEYKEHLTQHAKKIYNRFISDIAEMRNLSLKDEKIWADGKKLLGIDALDLGLIDALGDFSDAFDKMRELLQERGISIKDPLRVIEFGTF